MNHRHAPLKIAAVCFSMLMIGGYVYLRADGEPKVFHGSKSATGRVVDTPTTRQTIIFPGSKSATISTGGQDILFSDDSPAATQPDLTLAQQNHTPKPAAGISLGSPTTLPVFFPEPKPQTYNRRLITGGIVRMQEHELLELGVVTTRPAPAATAPATP